MYQQDPERKRKLAAGPMAVQQTQPRYTAPQPMAPQKGITEQFTDMAKQRAMTTALDKGASFSTDMIAKAMAPSATQAVTIGGAPATAAGGMAAQSGMGAALGTAGTAMPYIGMGLLGAKMLGLFSQGGYVGPLSGVAYKYNGGKISASFYNKAKE